MKLGLQLGYWGAQPPENHAELVATAEEAGFDALFTAEAWGSDAYTPLAWWGVGDEQDATGHVGGPVIRTNTDRVCDGGADAGPSLRRPPHPGSRSVGSAGGGGLVRPEVPQAVGPDPRIHRH